MGVGMTVAEIKHVCTWNVPCQTVPDVVRIMAITANNKSGRAVAKQARAYSPSYAV